nr:serine hydrolase domain-containing protein [Hymenobacter psoromatis]
MLRKLLLVLLLAVTAGRPTQAQRASHVISTLPELTDSIRRVMAQEHIPGLMLALVTRDSVLYAGGLGVANVVTNQPVTAHTLFRIGSVTKTFVAVGLLQLIAQGKLHLRDEVRKIAPEVPIDNPWEATDPVRVVHLLEHTAGFDDMHLNHFYNTTATDPRGVAGVAVFRPELRCRWRPGERMSYANPGCAVAGYLLEKFSGQPYAIPGPTPAAAPGDARRDGYPMPGRQPAAGPGLRLCRWPLPCAGSTTHLPRPRWLGKRLGGRYGGLGAVLPA